MDPNCAYHHKDNTSSTVAFCLGMGMNHKNAVGLVVQPEPRTEPISSLTNWFDSQFGAQQILFKETAVFSENCKNRLFYEVPLEFKRTALGSRKKGSSLLGAGAGWCFNRESPHLLPRSAWALTYSPLSPENAPDTQASQQDIIGREKTGREREASGREGMDS